MGLRFTLTRWRKPIFWSVVALVVLEFPLTVSTLALFGIADPDTYRTRLWQDGSNNGFNSDPSTPLYAAANYQSVKIPLIWSSSLTKYNLVISVLSMFILLLKSVLLPLNVLFPILSLAMHLVEVGLWSYSVYGQTSPDLIDPAHQVNGPPWYITKSCNVAFKKENVGYCQQAKASFYVTVVMLALFAYQAILAIFSIFYAPAKTPSDDGEKSVSSGKSHDYKMPLDLEPEREWEMVPIPETPGTTGGMKSPMTPRTRAYRDLDGKELYAPHAGYVPQSQPPLAPWGKKGLSEKMPWSAK